VQFQAAHRNSGGGQYSFKVLDRAVTVLEHVASVPSPVGVSALARRAGIPKSSAFRLLAALTDLGIVEHDREGYRLGQRMRHLVGLVHERIPQDLRRLAMPYLVELYERSGDIVTLGILDRDEMVVLETVRGHQHADLPDPPERSPAHCSAIGKLLLAWDPQWPPAGHAKDLRHCTDRSVASWASLGAELTRSRQTGTAFSDQQHVNGVIEVAMPVLDRDGAVAGIGRSRPAGSQFDPAGDAIHRQVAFAASTALRRLRLPWHPALPPA
jgi:IclR family transcriptional regulator, KDG regulon repressor